MAKISRRTLLQAAAATTGGVLLSGGLDNVVAQAAGPKNDRFTLEPVADLRDGRVRLHLPPGFQYRSFHDTDGPPIVLDDGTVLPGRHDGMGAFQGAGGNVWLVRNHEVNGPVGAFGAGTPYDPNTGGGTTTIEVTPDGQVLQAFTSLNGTQMNCAGGVMPWGSWITCEETVNGPDVGADFTHASNVTLTQRHGFIFEVPAGGESDRQPIRAAGRFAHEAAAYSPDEGIVYLTEDNFGFPSGLYRYIPPENPEQAGRLLDGGTAPDVARRRCAERASGGDADRSGRRTRSTGSTSTTRTRRSRTRRVCPPRRRTTTPSSTWATRVAPRGRPISRASKAPRTRRARSSSRRRKVGARPRSAPTPSVDTATGRARSGRTTLGDRR